MTLSGACLLWVSGQGVLEANAATAVALFLGGVGFGILESAWVEWLGLHSIPLVALLSYMVGWPFFSALWAPLKTLGATNPIFIIIILLLPALSLGMMVIDLMVKHGQGAMDEAPDLEPCGAREIRTNLPIMLWTWLFTVVYCIGTAYTAQGSSTLGEIMGLVILIAGFCVLGNSFDYTTLYRFSLVVLALGCAAASLGSESTGLIQACFSASNITIMALAATFFCASASLRRVSAAWAYSLLKLGWNAIALVTRHVAPLLGLETRASSVLFITIAGITVLLLGLAVWKETDLLSHWREACLSDPESLFAARCERLADQGGLGERETGVLVLLAQGKTYAEISEQLFMALGTVRAHAAHVYEKLGIHSRQELVELVESEEQ